ncbi:MAG: substrate-binding domain-containing protein [Fretibacterium sp.]|nr:substrate-binding domain-containing protein [Fretibacterium sp.]
MRMKKVLCVLLAAALLLVSGSAAMASLEKPKVGITVMVMNNPFFVSMVEAVKEEVAKLGGEVLVVDGNMDVQKQTAGVEDMLRQKIDFLLFNPVDSDAGEAAVSMAKEAGIPVICLDADSSGPRDLFIVSNNVGAGELCAEYVAERTKGKANVVIITGNPVSSTRDRYNGVMKVFEKYPDIKVVAEQNGEGLLERGMAVMENILQAQPKIDAVIGINDPMGLGALAAVESAGRQDEIFVVGVDGSPDALKAILKPSSYVMSAAQEPAKIGRMGVEYGMKMLRGEEIAEKEIYVPVKTITIENAKDFSW